MHGLSLRNCRGLVVLGLLLGTVHGLAQDVPPAPVPIQPHGSTLPATPPAYGSAPATDPPSGTQLNPPRAVTTPFSPPLPGGPPPAPFPGPVPPSQVPPPYGPPPQAAFMELPGVSPAGWFASIETNILAAHIKNRLVAFVDLGGLAVDIVHLPTAELDWTAAPRFEVGYQLPDAQGEFAFGYRFLATEGDFAIPPTPFNETAYLRSRLDFNVFDFDYATHDLALGPHWDLKWRVGVRLLTTYFDSELSDSAFRLRSTNHFVGAGPRGGIDLSRWLYWNNLALFGRLEGAIPIGRIAQTFDEQIDLAPAVLAGGATRQTGSQTVPMVSLNVGLRWVPGEGRRARYTLGYHWERWWDVGRVGNSGADLWYQGVFVRGEFSF